MNDIPYAWYLARSSALIGFFLLYISIFLGLAIRTPLLNKLIKPIYSTKIHCWISLQALIFAAVHGASLLLDKFIAFSWKNILIPFYPLTESQAQRIDVGFLALGIVGFYIMLLLVASSYLRKGLSSSLWRAVHFLNVGLYVIVIIHSLFLGTDLKNPGLARDIFIYANGFLMALFVANIFTRFFFMSFPDLPADEAGKREPSE
jgi:methionine sulfoxide reductase heme-binding subunit